MKQRSYLALEDIGVAFPTPKGPFQALKGVDLSIEKGEFVALIGHSGCGKSTLLNIVAGLTKPTRGVVFLEGDVIDKPGPDRAVIFQDHSLLPWMTVEENVRLAVDKTMAGKSRAERRDWVMHNLDLVQMTAAAAKRPAELSGGMKQRVGIARAIAMSPRVLLMDEPFGALDALTRASLQDAVMTIQTKLKNTVIMITHDVDEAVLLADRVVMMTNGPAATIGEDLHIDLPRPRNRIEMADTPAYNHARHDILEFLHQRFSNPMDRAA
ncbi:nitrate/nitrite transport system ATP-binding protein [Sphingomonas sp. YR710]|jgi:nitrate/nitrite transport system ATP-binding protein|uniref:ABC transporter ATP-binding protein n=1 Tax=Sphingomonas sp. YR710 TaxID=1882773 RepID=UPI000887E54B|nr:ABC transporter ATP-binding protein [Sphingomonas sp. YR710]SDD06156.1 nitrate/nitrite transport system ATP-binding protein [Sphingomonas sp. YR710]